MFKYDAKNDEILRIVPPEEASHIIQKDGEEVGALCYVRKEQLIYYMDKCKNRDNTIAALRRDNEYLTQRKAELETQYENALEYNKCDRLRGTIRGLEKTRDKQQAEINRLKKKLNKLERFVEDTDLVYRDKRRKSLYNVGIDLLSTTEILNIYLRERKDAKGDRETIRDFIEWILEKEELR